MTAFHKLTYAMPFKNFVASSRHFFLLLGIASVISACGGGGGGTTAAPINSAPVARLTANTDVVRGDAIVVSGAASNDPDGSTISFAWALTSQPATSAVNLNAGNISGISFTPAVIGVYVVRLTVTDPTGKTDQASITINLVNNSAPIANAGADQTVFVNSPVSLNGSASNDPNGDTLSYAWSMLNKPANSIAALSNANTVAPSFNADLTGDFTISLVVTDNRGSASVADLVRITVSGSPLATACGATPCAALSSSQYAGSGLGVWQYNNTSNSSTNLTVDIANVPAGKKVGLFFSNAQSAAAAALPSAGINASLDVQSDTLRSGSSYGSVDLKGLLLNAGMSDSLANLQLNHESAHEQMTQRNAQLKSRLEQSARIQKTADLQAATVSPKAAPVVGAARNWVDYFPSVPSAYATTNKFVCTLPSGRNAVFWQQDTDTNLTAATLTRFTTAACGTSGGFARIATLLGDAWGPHTFTDIITETTANKQDINIVFLSPGGGANWAGYFYALNNFISTAAQPTNQALAFFINTTELVNAGATEFYLSTLFHEATHMHNFYQNDVVRRKTLQTWMEEMHAIMSEDIVTPSVAAGYNKPSAFRIPGYLAAKGGVDLINWPTTLGSNSSAYYNMAAAFAAYINRQYGIGVYQQLTSSCTTGLAKTDSYECLKTVLLANGSPGLAIDFSRMGASTFGLLGGAGNPSGFGFPAKASGAYSLDAIDLSGRAWDTAAATSLAGSYKPMSQWYVRDVQAAGKTRYIRNSVTVPAQTTLHLVIKD